MAVRPEKEYADMLKKDQVIAPGLPDRDTRLGVFESVVTDTKNGVVVTTPDGHAVFVNPAFTEITGYSRDHVIGKNMRILQSGRQSQSFYEAMWQTLRAQGNWSGTIWNRRRDGEVYQEWLTVNAICNEEQQAVAYVGVFSDISSIASREHQLERMAYFDPLTELPNQLLFQDRLAQALGFARQGDEALSVIVADLDRVGAVNEQYGFLVGDRLLQNISQRILTGLGGRDCVGRIGGDAFSVVVVGDREHMVRVTEMIHTTIAQPHEEPEPPITITASIGVACFPGDADEAETLLSHAKTAMYAAKSGGGNRIRYYADVQSRVGP
jgi:diguanylate cyclase (GGDEF)-like protein/PAS domain S-box-containing protein